MDEKETLIEKLCALDPRIKTHFVDSESIMYCDERCITLLEVSQVKETPTHVTWAFHFVESDETYTFTKEK